MPVVNYTTVNGRILHEDRNGVKTLFMPDTLGNVIETRNMDTGAQTSSTTYWPYGEVRTQTGTNPSPFGFCGVWGYYTQAGQPTYVRARYYRPHLGRWQTVDPLWPQQSSYSYSSSPLTRVDYWGEQDYIYPWPPKPSPWDNRVGIDRAKEVAKEAGGLARSAWVDFVGNVELNLRGNWCLDCARRWRSYSDNIVKGPLRSKPGMRDLDPTGDTAFNAVMHCTSACFGLIKCGRAIADEYYNNIYEGWLLKGGPGDKHNNNQGFDCGESLVGPLLTPINCMECCYSKYRKGELRWH
ncbi:MAG: RHS repeat-associated core domain-containing protein [Armatimonadota bacterium]|jgi:RHS repeat-associated protein